MSTSFRGMYLERLIERCNKVYQVKGIAQIDKVATPMNIRSRNNQIVSAKHGKKSTVDFVGIIKGGQAVMFDTKETSVPRFPFANVEAHQERYLTNIKNLGGQAFLLIFFKKENELYRLDIEEYTELKNTIERKSIPYEWFKTNKRPIQSKNGIPYDYL